jgi:ferredoxin
VTDDETRLVSAQVNGAEVLIEEGRPLLHALLKIGQRVETACGGKGTCHLCRVKILPDSSPLPPPETMEVRALGNVLIKQGMRLSCQISAQPGLRIEVPHFETIEERRARIRRAKENKK